MGSSDGSVVNHPPAMQVMWDTRVRSLGQEDPLEKDMAAHSSVFAGKWRGQRSLVGYSPWGCKELDMTQHVHTHTHTHTHTAGRSAGEQVSRTHPEPAFS